VALDSRIGPPEEMTAASGRQVSVAAQSCIQTVAGGGEDADQTSEHRHHRADKSSQQEGGRDVAFAFGCRRVVGVD